MLGPKNCSELGLRSGWNLRGVLFVVFLLECKCNVKKLTTIGLYIATKVKRIICQQDWVHHKRIAILRSKPCAFPGDPEYPLTSDRYEPDDYHDFGFKKSHFYKSAEQIRAEYAAELKANKAREAKMLRE